MDKLTRGEQDIMEQLWDSALPMDCQELRDGQHSYKNSSFYIMLGGLLRKGMVKEEGHIKRTKTYARTFAPAVSRERYGAFLALSAGRPNEVRLILEILRASHMTNAQRRTVLNVCLKEVGEE